MPNYNYNDYHDYNMMYYNSDNDDNDYYENEYPEIYGPEEQSETKYNLINYEIYNPYIHGKSNPLLYTQLLVCDRYKYTDINSIENMNYQGEHINIVVCERISCMPTYIHPFIRNYKSIIMQTAGKLEIAECIYLENNEMVAILKTFWIKIIQRTWKNIFQERKRIQKLRMRIASVIYREINGSWPVECKNMPGLHGMLYELL